MRLLILMGIALMHLVVLPLASAEEIGDINGDGNQDTTDVQLILDVLVGTQAADTSPAIHFSIAADVNDDGVINNLDAVLILAVITGEIARPLDATAIAITDNGDGTVTIAGAIGVAPAGSSLSLINTTSSTIGTVTVEPDGSFQGSIAAATGDAIAVGVANEPLAVTLIVGDPSPFILGFSRLGDGTHRLQ